MYVQLLKITRHTKTPKISQKGQSIQSRHCRDDSIIKPETLETTVVTMLKACNGAAQSQTRLKRLSSSSKGVSKHDIDFLKLGLTWMHGIDIPGTRPADNPGCSE